MRLVPREMAKIWKSILKKFSRVSYFRSFPPALSFALFVQHKKAHRRGEKGRRGEGHE